MTKEFVLYADGGSRGNPGVAGFGAAVFDSRGSHVVDVWGYIDHATNNVAEYRGLIAGLEYVAGACPGAVVEARLDSKLVVEQMSGRWKIKNPGLAPLAEQARDVSENLNVRYTWIPRAENSHADALANKAMDTREGGSTQAGPGGLDAAREASGYAGDVTPRDAYAALADPSVRLIDVRTRAEWSFVGVPRVPESAPDPVFVEWTTFPDGTPNHDFTEQALAACPDASAVIMLCRSGARSVAAARAWTAQSQVPAYNVLEGFEGDLDADQHRGVGGWKSANLPWRQ